MGIDKSNIWWTTHYGNPGSVEAFHQAVGRAGRDRQLVNYLFILAECDDQLVLKLLDETTPIEEARALAKP